MLAGFVVVVTPEPSVHPRRGHGGWSRSSRWRPAGRRGDSRCSASRSSCCSTIDPWLSRSYGFALSVLATAGLLLLARPLAEVMARWLPRGLALVLAVPLAAQLACQPVLLMLNPSLPLYGVAANLLAEPAAAPVTVLGLIACVAAPVVPAARDGRLGHRVAARELDRRGRDLLRRAARAPVPRGRRVRSASCCCRR